MAIKYSGSKKEELEAKSLSGFYQSKPSMPEGSFPHPEDQPVSWCHLWAPEDELFRLF